MTQDEAGGGGGRQRDEGDDGETEPQRIYLYKRLRHIRCN